MSKYGSMVQRTLALTAMATAAATLVAACGGSSNAGSSLTLSGTAAMGAAMVGASVTAKCAAGTQTGKTLEDGTYSMSVAGGALPCVLQATSGGTTLYSLAQGSGDKAVANITPITHIVVVKTMGDEATAKATFGASPTASQLNAAIAKLADALAAVRVALAGVANYSEDPFTTPFTAAHGSVKGDGVDQKLDALQDKLDAAQSTLTQLTHAIATSQSAADKEASPAVDGVLTPPADAACPNVRSGEFIVASQSGRLGSSNDGPGVFDVAARTWTEPDGRVFPTGLDANTCQMILYQEDGVTESVRAAFNAQGLGIWRDAAGTGSSTFGLVFPFQRNTLADLAGNWNLVAFNREDTASTGAFGMAKAVISTAGGLTTSHCPTTDGTTSCEAWQTASTAMSVTNGKFTGADGHGYLFKAANGTKLYVHSFGEEYGLMMGTQPQAMTLPAVGGAVNFWDVSGSFSGASALSSASYTIASVDAAASSYTRSDGQVRVINKPLEGMSYRAATADKGAAIYLHAKDLLTVYGREKKDASTYVGFSIAK